MKYIETSAKTDHNVSAAFDSLASDILSKVKSGEINLKYNVN